MKIAARHSCEVTIERISDTVQRYSDRFTADEIKALTAGCAALARITAEDRTEP